MSEFIVGLAVIMLAVDVVRLAVWALGGMGQRISRDFPELHGKDWP